MHSLQLRRSPQRRRRAASHANSNGRISSGGPCLGEQGKQKSVTCPDMEDGNFENEAFLEESEVEQSKYDVIQFLGSA